MLSEKQVQSYNEKGFLHIPNVFSAEEVKAMRDDLNWMIETWADKSKGWSGPWRNAYMDEETEKASQLVSMHDLHFYSEAWMRGVTQQKFCAMLGQLLDEQVELHHSTMHVKPQEVGHPFPMHQDWWFYGHRDARYVDALFHLDDTCHENGEIRFVEASHKQGVIEHVTETDGQPCTPHLPTADWPLEDTVAVPAKAGDVVLFNIHTVHGSYINQTDDLRRMVRVGYKHPHNEQLSGQSVKRPGLMVYGSRLRREGEALKSIDGPANGQIYEAGLVQEAQKLIEA